MQKGMAETTRSRHSRGRSSTYDVGADLLAGDLVVDDHLEGMGWETAGVQKRCGSGILRLGRRDEVGTETAFLDVVSAVIG